MKQKRKKEEICMFDRGAAEACIVEQNTRWDVGNVDDYDERMGYGM